ncbi:MAG: ABC transporter substrate-binding protein [Provencibacterium sp.]|jgi:sn-glycerol 3-phosphate transport system substrate-binding protein|nr:ABC transporter substrate-binding protein [Provencibacterium sp.]
MKKTAVALCMSLMLGMFVGCSSGGSAPGGQNAASGGSAKSSGKQVEVEFYYPVQVGGAIAQLVESYASDFAAENPDIKVSPVFSGGYADTLQKLITAIQADNQPQFCILANPTILTLISMDAIIPLDDLINKDGGSEYINDFYPGFMANSVFDGKVWSIPFQRSALLMFYNRDHFREVGLDPEKPPKSWEEMAEYGQKLTKFDQNGNVQRWGLLIPSGGAWDFGPFAIANSANGENLMTDDGRKCLLDTPENVEALQYLKDLGTVYKASPEGVVDMATAPANFIEGKASMIQVSSGNLANINSSADFDWGICLLPYTKRPASIAGGGNLYLMKGSSEEELDATWRFVRWLTEPERQAQWNVDTGYIAARKSAHETETMRKYYEEVPQAKIGFEQLESCYNEMRVYESEKIGNALTDKYDAVMTGSLTVEEALKELQAFADETLAPYNK